MSNTPVVLDEKDKNLIELVKQQIARGATDIELRYFVNVCNRMGLDPFSRQIWAIKRWDSSLGNYAMGIQVGIDGFRHTANRTGLYGGQIGPVWCGQDGVWKDIWLSDEPPFAAKVGIIRTDFKEPIYAIAKYSAMVQLTKEKKPNAFWTKMPDHMLAKCAEAQAIRKCFGSEFVGVFSEDETAMAPEPDLASPSYKAEKVFEKYNQSIKDVTPTKEELQKHEDAIEKPVEKLTKKPIVNHAAKISSNAEYRTPFGFGNYPKGIALRELGTNGVKDMQKTILIWTVKEIEQGKVIPPQIQEFLDQAKIYLVNE